VSIEEELSIEELKNALFAVYSCNAFSRLVTPDLDKKLRAAVALRYIASGYTQPISFDIFVKVYLDRHTELNDLYEKCLLPLQKD
jgi:hypothetical protein